MSEESAITPPTGGYTKDSATEAIEAIFDKAIYDEPEGEPEEKPDEPEETEEESEEAPQGEPEEEAEEEAETEESEEAEEEAPEISSFQDLAKALDISEDDLATIKVNTKVDGQVSEVALSDLVRGYQTDSHNTRKSQQLEQQRKEMEAQKVEQHKQYEQGLHQFGSMVAALEQQVVGAINGEEMAQLKSTDQTAWMAKRMEMQDALHQFAQLKQAAAQKYADNQKALKDQQDAQAQELLKQSQEQLPQVIPDWSDETRRAIVDYAMSQGLSAEEVGSIIDYRHVALIDKARRYDAGLTQQKEQQGKADLAKKRVKKLPTTVKKSAKKTLAPEARKIKEARERFKKGKKSGQGGIQNRAAMIESLLR